MIMMTNKFMRKREKIKAQVKSRFYYWFWGATAVAVVGGQLYVGTSYRIMAKSMNRWFEETVDLLQDPIKPRTGDKGYYMPMPGSEIYPDYSGIQ